MKMIRSATHLLGCLLLLVIWQVAGAELSESLLATPAQVFAALGDTLCGPAFWTALGQMLGQMLVGYGLALLVGVPLGIAMGRSPVVRALVKPWAAMFIVVSAAALVPLFILVLGRGVLLCVAIVFVATVWFVVTTMMEAARAVSPNLLAVARSYGATPLQSFRLVLLPALHPYVLIAARIGLTHALRAMVTAEMFISTGYGGLINDAGLEMSTAPLFGLIVMLMLLSVGTTGLLRWAAHRSAPWYASRTGDR